MVRRAQHFAGLAHHPEQVTNEVRNASKGLIKKGF